MRPIERGASPQASDFDDYRDAFGSLVGRLGPYCSYCERRLVTNLAVEHLQPKGRPEYESLRGRWENFLLGCVNCNGTKGDKDVRFDELYFPDRDNTAAAFDYTADGRMIPSPRVSGNQTSRKMAEDTLKLTGLDKPWNEITDENGELVFVDRVSERMQTWLMAMSSLEDYEAGPSEGMRRQVVKTAQAAGFFSIWMKVFASHSEIRTLLIQGFDNGGQFYGFEGTARDCFDSNTRQVSPRPTVAGLEHSGKI